MTSERLFLKAKVNMVSGIDTMHTSEFSFEGVSNITACETNRRQTIDEGKMKLVYFCTDTCPVCKHLKDTTFKDAPAQAKLKESYVVVDVNMSDNADKKILASKKKFQVFVLLGFVFWTLKMAR